MLIRTLYSQIVLAFQMYFISI